MTVIVSVKAEQHFLLVNGILFPQYIHYTAFLCHYIFQSGEWTYQVGELEVKADCKQCGLMNNGRDTSRLYGSDKNLERTVSMKTIGEQIRFYRLQKGLTQEELGRRVLISNSTISLYENNARPVPADVIITLCKALDVTPNMLLGFEAADNKKKVLDEVTAFFSVIYDKYMK